MPYCGSVTIVHRVSSLADFVLATRNLCLRDGSVYKVWGAAKLKLKLQVKLAVSPSPSILTLGQPVLTLAILRGASDRVAPTMFFF